MEENIKNLIEKLTILGEELADTGYFGGRESVIRQLVLLLEEKRSLGDDVAVAVLEWAIDRLQ
jgi:hypothetical protein